MARKNTIKGWAVIWKDTGNVVEEFVDGSYFFHVFRTRAEARRQCREDRKVIRIQFSMRVL